MRAAEWGLGLVLAIVGVYFLVFHQDPLPLNHEAIGLGKLHLLHDVVGVVLLGVAGLVVWRSRRGVRARSPT